MIVKFAKRKLHPQAWYVARNRRGPGMNVRQVLRRRRLQRLMKFTWALRKIWAAGQLWKRLMMRPGLDNKIA
jgi:hypothetical protein